MICFQITFLLLLTSNFFKTIFSYFLLPTSCFLLPTSYFLLARDFVDNFPTHFLKSITFLHPMGVCGWTFHCTAPL